MKKILLINPWIYDFSAYDFGMKPVGLLRIAEYLRRNGDDIFYIDCLEGCAEQKDQYGFSRISKVIVKKPEIIKEIVRPYFRYGISEPELHMKLDALPKIDAIYITSGMTYWYPGVFALIDILKDRYPKNPIVLGGIYPTLAYDHAKHVSGADVVWKGDYIKDFYKEDYYPAYDLVNDTSILPIQLTEGCPYRCSYCASGILKPRFHLRDPLELFEETMFYYNNYGTRTFVFYDDALTVYSEKGIKKFLRMVIASKADISFHTPNGLHAKYVDDELAFLLKKANFKELRLSLETSDENLQIFTGGKVTNRDLKTSIRNLKEAGFGKNDIGVYIIIGSPWLPVEKSMSDIMFVNSLGAKAMIASYSPIPGTPDFGALTKSGLIDKDTDPLWHNKTIFSELLEPKYTRKIQELRKLTAKLNRE